ncbi:MAG TPA: MFS transporter, partial [Ktedonobacterales bacterium]|nr:MFS transporter [Ktedonobacterales bacterium]
MLVLSGAWQTISTTLGDYRAVLRIRNLRLLALTRLCAFMIFYSSVIAIFERSRGLDFTQIFLLESIISLAALLFDVPTSVWADRIGYHWLLLLGRGLECVGMVIWIFSYGFWPFAFCSFLSGVSIACISGCEDALIASSVYAAQMEAGADRHNAPSSGSAFALLGAASNVGFFLGLAFGSFMGAHNPVIPFAVTLAPLTASVALTLALRPPAPS